MDCCFSGCIVLGHDLLSRPCGVTQAVYLLTCCALGDKFGFIVSDTPMCTGYRVLSQERKTIRAPPSSLPSPSPSLPLPPWLKRSASGSNVQQAPILCQVSIQRPPEGTHQQAANGPPQSYPMRFNWQSFCESRHTAVDTAKMILA